MFGLWVYLTQQHDPRLVSTAVVCCLLASFGALNLLARAVSTRKARIWIWLCASTLFTLSIGCVIFIAFASFSDRVGVAYDPATLIAGWVWLAGGCYAGFAVRVGTRRRFAGAAAAAPVLAGGLVGALYWAHRALDLPVSIDRIAFALIVVTGFAGLAMFRLRHASLLQRIEAAGYLAFGVIFGYASVFSGQPWSPSRLVEVASLHDFPSLVTPAIAVALGAIVVALLVELMEQSLAQRVRLESRKMLKIAGGGFEGIIIHRAGIILEVSEEFARLGGWKSEAITGLSVIDLVAAADLDRANVMLAAGPSLASAVALDLQARDGTLLPVEMQAYPIAYDSEGDAQMLGVHDLTARMRAAERIRHLAHHDALTGLPNRFLLADRLSHLLSLADRAGSSVGVFFLGLDRFKQVNDVLGHEAGDLVLNEVAQRLRDLLRATDTPARLGGDEFAILQPLVQSPNEAAALAQRLIEAMAQPFIVSGQQIEIGVSIGIALSPASGRTTPELLRNADTAMNRAKAEQKGSFLFFERTMDEQLQQRRFLEQDLKLALVRNELELHYQPLFDAKTVAIVGFEALVRWHHPTRGMISPAEFIPLAEECGIIVALGQWVLEKACSDAASWEQPHRIAVNLSPAQFRQSDLLEQVASTLAATGLPAGQLELEVTEGVLIDNTRRAREVLEGLKSLGVNISLDDFGTGYSSLSYLRRFPFDKIKIDKAFVNGLGQDEEAAAIVRAIVALGHSLKLSVTAEGVETEMQLAALDALDCNQVQGFLLGRPTPKEGLPFYFARHDEVMAALDAERALAASPVTLAIAV